MQGDADQMGEIRRGLETVEPERMGPLRTVRGEDQVRARSLRLDVRSGCVREYARACGGHRRIRAGRDDHRDAGLQRGESGGDLGDLGLEDPSCSGSRL